MTSKTNKKFSREYIESKFGTVLRPFSHRHFESTKEPIVCKLYGLKLNLDGGRSRHDAETFDKVPVEIKSLSGANSRINFHRLPRDGYLLVMKFEFDGDISEIYNGPVNYLLQEISQKQIELQGPLWSISENELRRVMDGVPIEQRLTPADLQTRTHNRENSTQQACCSIAIAATGLAATLVPFALTRKYDVSESDRLLLVKALANAIEASMKGDPEFSTHSSDPDTDTDSDIDQSKISRFVTIDETDAGQYKPVVVQLKFSAAISALFGAVGSIAGGGLLPVAAGALVSGLIANFFDFMGQRTAFNELASQIAYELFRSTNSGDKKIHIPLDVLKASVDQSLEKAGLPAISPELFNSEIQFLRGKGVITGHQPQGTVTWSEFVFKFPHHFAS